MKSLIISTALLLGSISYGQNSLCTVAESTVERIEYYRTAIPYIKMSYVSNSIEMLIQEDACLEKFLKPDAQVNLTNEIITSREASIKNLIVLTLVKAQSEN